MTPMLKEICDLFTKWEDDPEGFTDVELARLNSELQQLTQIVTHAMANRLLSYSNDEEVN